MKKACSIAILVWILFASVAPMSEALSEGSKDAPTAARAKSILSQRASVDPQKDFEALLEPDFNHQKTRFFSGTFEDRESRFEMRLSVDFSRGQGKISKKTCIMMPQIGRISGGEGVSFKDDRAGYAGMMLKDRWYLKLAYAFTPDRALYGKLYERKARGWEFVRDVVAREDASLKIHCGASSRK